MQPQAIVKTLQSEEYTESVGITNVIHSIPHSKNTKTTSPSLSRRLIAKLVQSLFSIAPAVK